jgi:hypothetical protein
MIRQRKPKILREVVQCHFVHHESHMKSPEVELGPPCELSNTE